MYRQPCRDTGNKKEQFTYRVRIARKDNNGQLMVFLPEGKNSQSLIDKEYCIENHEERHGKKGQPTYRLSVNKVKHV